MNLIDKAAQRRDRILLGRSIGERLVEVLDLTPIVGGDRRMQRDDRQRLEFRKRAGRSLLSVRALANASRISGNSEPPVEGR